MSIRRVAAIGSGRVVSFRHGGLTRHEDNSPAPIVAHRRHRHYGAAQRDRHTLAGVLVIRHVRRRVARSSKHSRRRVSRISQRHVRHAHRHRRRREHAMDDDRAGRDIRLDPVLDRVHAKVLRPSVRQCVEQSAYARGDGELKRRNAIPCTSVGRFARRGRRAL